MAEIKMDVSEYEAMKENKRLLENALDEQRKMHEEIKQLKQEKIDALEEAKMKVVKITRTEHREHALTVRPKSQDALESLLYYVGAIERDYYSRGARTVKPGRATDMSDSSWQRLIDMFFKIHSITSFPESSTTLHGLDEITAELKAEAEKSAKAGVEAKLESAELELRKADSLQKRINELHEESDLHKSNCEKLKKQLEELSESHAIRTLEWETVPVYKAFSDLIVAAYKSNSSGIRFKRRAFASEVESYIKDFMKDIEMQKIKIKALKDARREDD